jgi:hypothetical protein
MEVVKNDCAALVIRLDLSRKQSVCGRHDLSL